MEVWLVWRERRTACRILVWKPLGNSPVGIRGRRLYGRIKWNLKDARCREMSWMELAQYHVERCVSVLVISSLRLCYQRVGVICRPLYKYEAVYDYACVLFYCV
jgi:hypothetical protein